MGISKTRYAAVFKKRILIGTRLGLAKPEDAWIELREPTLGEITEMGARDNAGKLVIQKSLDLVLNCTIDHNLEDETGKVATLEDAKEFLHEVFSKSSTLFTYVATAWEEALPLVNRSAGK